MKGNGEKSAATVLLLGLPDAGKTTFLAALWHVVHSKEVSGSLSLKTLEGDRDHLNAICEKWRRFEQMERTHPSSEKFVRMRLIAGSNSPGVQLVVPDMAGDSFEGFLEGRQWPTEFDEFVQGVEGFLLFVHPDRVREPVTINETASALEALGGGEVDAENHPTSVEPYEPRVMNPTQVKLVDLIQLIAGRRPTPRSYRVAVIISAWDVVKDTDESPERWLDERLPLLSQYLRTNDELLDMRIYGLSAQGGDLTDDRELLEEVLIPSNRIKVVEGEMVSHDITAPLRWLMVDHL